ncbi:hypothetical protein ASPBRDRAFT_79680 [Aspergillus brasiliensis CBS 101740]|uniref:C2H2-type domain-containing protein n=1 Tax=Aspergillus brasiliensis (strain CBS 101740 / IMI 381727 / IBT 21946) TaxID=767769 RepID=A0A1L9U1W3_ASPBC|nr:hypothetical protein ASPBRDRAFT_79680 [Aspergillus brasiliensis CBS 101740]
MTTVSIGQAEDEHHPAWPQNEVTSSLVGRVGFSPIYFGADLSSFSLEGYCDPIVIGGKQGELLAPPSTIMTDTVIGDSREPSWPEQYLNLVAPNNLLPLEDFAQNQSHSANIVETSTLTTRFGLDGCLSDEGYKSTTAAVVVGGRADSGTRLSRFQEAPMPSYDHDTSLEDGLYHCQDRACVAQTGFPRKCDLQKHMRSHVKPVKCPICTVTKAQQVHMRRHIEVHHGGWARQGWQVGVVCELCGKSFTRDNLRRHYRSQHEDFSSLSVPD